jgi:AGCS family alanine or glycine:cation symporter
MESFKQFLDVANGFLWGPVMLVLLLGTGIMFTLRLRFIQITKLKLAFKNIFKKSHDSGDEHEGFLGRVIGD